MVRGRVRGHEPVLCLGEELRAETFDRVEKVVDVVDGRGRVAVHRSEHVKRLVWVDKVVVGAALQPEPVDIERAALVDTLLDREVELSGMKAILHELMSDMFRSTILGRLSVISD